MSSAARVQELQEQLLEQQKQIATLLRAQHDEQRAKLQAQTEESAKLKKYKEKYRALQAKLKEQNLPEASPEDATRRARLSALRAHLPSGFKSALLEDEPERDEVKQKEPVPPPAQPDVASSDHCEDEEEEEEEEEEEAEEDVEEEESEKEASPPAPSTRSSQRKRVSASPVRRRQWSPRRRRETRAAGRPSVERDPRPPATATRSPSRTRDLGSPVRRRQWSPRRRQETRAARNPSVERGSRRAVRDPAAQAARPRSRSVARLSKSEVRRLISPQRQRRPWHRSRKNKRNIDDTDKVTNKKELEKEPGVWWPPPPPPPAPKRRPTPPWREGR